MDSLAEGQRMLDLFATVGADRFYVTKTDILENKTRAWPATLERLRETLPAVLRAAAVRKPIRTGDGQIVRAGENVIVRPISQTTTFIQLDDLSGELIERIRPVAFLVLATSPGNHQAWIAVSDLRQTPGDQVKDFVRRVKKGISDKSASGAVRLAGSENFKLKYHPDFPRVAIVESVPGRTVTAEQLESLGLVGAPEPAKEPLLPFRASRNKRLRTWPSYQQPLEGAPAARNHKGRDRSMADFVWCMTAIDWGFSIEATAEKLLEESAKAHDKGRDYALQTARNAYRKVEKNRAGQGRSRA
jgi:RepB DNA-primase from phage plasmid